MLGEKQRQEALGVGLLALGVLVGFAVISPWFSEEGRNWIGPAGALLHRAATFALGPLAFLIALPAVIWGVHLLGPLDRARVVRWSILAVGVLVVAPAAAWLFMSAGTGAADGAGWLGVTLGGALRTGFGQVGGLLIASALLLVLLTLTLGWSIPRATAEGGRLLSRGAAAGGSGMRALAGAVRGLYRGGAPGETPWETAARLKEPALAPEPEVEPESEPAAETGERRNGRPAPSEPAVPSLSDPGDMKQTELPPIELLEDPVRHASGLEARDLKTLGNVLIEKLATFRIDGTIGGWTTGPVVTQFEVVPAPGVKVGQIAARADDLALALKAPSVRIVAPIPGKGAVGVEVPNPEPEIVYLKEVLEAPAFRRSRAALPLALGRDLSGRPYCADLTRMPHLLIAGATGSGKSICMNTIITSLIYRYTPRELRLLMIDPKMVELSVYGDLPHLRHPVITDNDDAASVLKWAVFEMKRRFGLLSANGCRNTGEFNTRLRQGRELVHRGVTDDGDPRPYEEGQLPFVVLLVDELADLMMTVQAEIETPLAMLAQKARAVGIHLVVATQRPSVNVLTGLIKANFPSRIAFRVASKIDSRTILDQNGAESLLGTGDMLFLPPAESDPIRIQGAYISSEETERLLEWYRAQAEARAAEEAREAEEPDILELVRELEEQESRVGVAGEVLDDRDELFRQAAEIVITNSAGSTSLLQRRLKIGYGRAARIIDQLHHAGVVGPADGSKPREILLSLHELDEVLTER